MSDETLPMEGGLPDAHGKIDAVCASFIEALRKSGPPPEIESFLHEVEEGHQETLVERLIGIELTETSTSEDEERTGTEEYFARFAKFAPAVRRALNRVGMATVSVSPGKQPDGEGPADGIIGEINPELKYAPGEEVARGGMGAIHLAQDRALRREVAMKTVLDLKSVSHRNLARFVEEAQITGQLEHPGIVPVYEMGVDPEKQVFYTMKFVKGRDLQSVLNGIREGDAGLIEEFPLHRLIEVFRRVCDAVAFAHSRGVIHRDLKPANIMLGEFGEVLVMDWGLAKIMGESESDGGGNTADAHQVESIRTDDESGHFHTLDGAVMGSPHYMSPEQAEGRTHELDHRTDIYSLGAILYAILTLRPPVEGTSISELLEKITSGAVVHPARQTEGKRPDDLKKTAPHCPGNRIPDPLAAVAMRALAKDFPDRYDTVRLLQKDLDAYQRGFATSAEGAGFWRHASLFVRRHKAAVAVLALIGVLLAVSSVVNYQARKRADLERDRAEQLSAWLEAERSESLFAEGKDREALSYLARQLRRNPADRLTANRLLSALTWRDFPLPLHPPLTHQSRIGHVAFSPDGKTAYTASMAKYDSRVVSWDVGTGEMLHSMRHGESIQGMTMSADGRMIGTVSLDGTARVWNAVSGEADTPPLKLDSSRFIRAISFSPDGKLVAAANAKKVLVWRIPSGDRVETGIPPAVNFIFDVKFSPNGRHLALGLLESKIRVFTVGEWQPAFPEMRLSEGVLRLAYSPDGTILASGGHRGVRFWDAGTGKPLGKPMPMDGNVHTLEFDPSGKRIVAGSSAGYGRVWDVEKSEPVTEPLHHLAAIKRVRFSPVGDRVLTASIDHTARFWDAESGEPVGQPLRQHLHISDAAISSDGGTAVTSSNDRSANLWDVRPGNARFSNLPIDGDIISANLLPDGQTLFCLKYRSAHVIDLKTMQEIREPVLSEVNFTAGDLHRNGRWLATVDQKGALAIRDLKSGEVILQERVPHEGRSASFSPDGNSFVVLWAGAANINRLPVLKAWNTENWKVLYSRQIDLGRGDAFTWSHDGTRIQMEASNAGWRLFNAIDGEPLANQLLRKFRAAGLKVEGKMRDAEFSSDDERIVTGTDLGDVRIWNGNHGEPETAPMQQNGPIQSVAWSPDNSKVISGSEDGTAQIWDSETAEPLVELMQHDAPVAQVAFHPNGDLVATATATGKIRVWDANVGQPVSIEFEHDGAPVRLLKFAGPDGNQLVSVSDGDSIRSWPVPAIAEPAPEWLPDLAEALGGDRINEKGIRSEVPVSELAELRKRLSGLKGSDPWSRWVRWFFGDREKRASFPEF